MTAPLVFLDTETTGLHPGRDAWEIAMIRRDSHGETSCSFFVRSKDIDLAHADPFGLKIGRFWDRHPDFHDYDCDIDDYVDGSSVYKPGEIVLLTGHQAARTVMEWTADAHIVGAVPNFDTEVLANLLYRHNLLPRWHYHLIDVENLAVGHIAAMLRLFNGDLLDTPRELVHAAIQPPWSSDQLGELLGCVIDEELRHTAYGDAAWARDLYDQCTWT